MRIIARTRPLRRIQSRPPSNLHLLRRCISSRSLEEPPSAYPPISLPQAQAFVSLPTLLFSLSKSRSANPSSLLPSQAHLRRSPPSSAMVLATNLGFPRMGSQRQLKKAVEAFWAGKTTEGELMATAKALREAHWKLQKDAGMEHIPSNDFSLFDHVLDTSAMVGAVPARFHSLAPGTETYFAMARGLQRPADAASGAPAVDVESLEMKKWMDTNYHFFVPELANGMVFELKGSKPLEEYLEARALGIQTRPVLLGPVSFLLLSKPARGQDALSFRPLSLLPGLLAVYQKLLQQLAEGGAEWVQIDEPVLCLDHDAEKGVEEAVTAAYKLLSQSPLKVLVATYFERAADNLAPLFSLPVAAIHVDLVRAPGQLPAVLGALGAHQTLSLGLVDGRNVWRTNLDKCLETAREVVSLLGPHRVFVAPSCSLLHCPHSLEGETSLDPSLKSWLAFAVEKLREVKVLATALQQGEAAVAGELEAARSAVRQRATSSLIHNKAVQGAVAAVGPAMMRRQSLFPVRRAAQQASLKLPRFCTTTIGSFPQTPEVRSWRAQFKKGQLSQEQYDALLGREMERCVKAQEVLGLDVLVHGEFERTDMVEYFGENLQGFAFTKNGWVQSYGSRCVKPPIIFGDVSRPLPMTVGWATRAQALTSKPMKGMLTGPVTCLQWSFVRDDQPRRDTAYQLALAIRQEVQDLEAAGIRVIQVDEAAIREGLPLRGADWEGYLQWAVDAFLISSTGVGDSTQIHTHMCYSDFNDIFTAIQRMDADVLTIENSKSDLKLLRAFERHGHVNEIGPGLYDIHSPRVPSVDEMASRLQAMLSFLPSDLLWVNPDCGLKTRGWAESLAALQNMVEVAKRFRASVEEA